MHRTWHVARYLLHPIAHVHHWQHLKYVHLCQRDWWKLHTEDICCSFLLLNFSLKVEKYTQYTLILRTYTKDIFHYLVKETREVQDNKEHKCAHLHRQTRHLQFNEYSNRHWKTKTLIEGSPSLTHTQFKLRHMHPLTLVRTQTHAPVHMQLNASSRKESNRSLHNVLRTSVSHLRDSHQHLSHTQHLKK